ncbi:MAG: hypothetical protein ACJAY7_000480 [Pseudohongiellaceae bacterium]|jgi:hypothetical protein
MFRDSRIAIEAIAIVASILLAFAIDAWWDSRSETQKSDSQLETVYSELSSIDDYISYLLVDFERSRSAIIALLEHIGPETELVSSDQLFELIDFSFRMPTIELEAGSITALLASGELSSISDAKLKSSLASWQARVARLRTKSGLLESNRELIIEYLLDKVPSLEIAQKTGQMTRYPLSSFQTEPALFQRDMKVEGLFANRGMILEDTEIHLIAVQEAVTLILTRIGTPGN